ncbi:hypothetical protein [Mesorhizobium sp. WSM4884]|uniref:hypothetical protein n=1 Tax=Mesorhizobium sp. WSM4884 TaxID=3038542 RepID=UPI002417F29F|nr:hypothetical protein [Mesorhizobium sp. WSM4884]MDG4882571.1 hypothetical protein [Mesorhizobium sp. WSM4884]
MFTHTASSLTAMPVGSHERPHPAKGYILHSNRVGLDRQDVLPKVHTAEGLERFEAHVQIVEDDDALARIVKNPRYCFCLLFPGFSTDSVTTRIAFTAISQAYPEGEKPKAAGI